MLHGSMVGFLQALPHLGITAVILLDIMKCVLGLNGAWFLWGMSDASKRGASEKKCEAQVRALPSASHTRQLQGLDTVLRLCGMSVVAILGIGFLLSIRKVGRWWSADMVALQEARMVLAGAGDSSINAAGIYMKIQGQSGEMTFATSEPIGSADDKVQIDMAKMVNLPLMAAYLELEVIQNTPSTASPHKDLLSAHPRRPPLGACQMAQILRRTLPSPK